MSNISHIQLPNGNTYDLRDENASQVMELTQAQYDALTPAEKNNGTVYFITDGSDSGVDASDIRAEALDGTASDVQALLDENATTISEMPVLVITSTNISALPLTITNSKITTDMVAINSVLSNPSAQTGDWTVNTDTAGQAVISGTISGTTDLTLYLAKSRS